MPITNFNITDQSVANEHVFEYDHSQLVTVHDNKVLHVLNVLGKNL